VNLLYIFFILITASATETIAWRGEGVHRHHSYNPINIQNDTMHSTSSQALLAVPNSMVLQGNSCFPFKGFNWPRVNLFGKMRKKSENHIFIFHLY
jgi:hypothetical protein